MTESNNKLEEQFENEGKRLVRDSINDRGIIDLNNDGDGDISIGVFKLLVLFFLYPEESKAKLKKDFSIFVRSMIIAFMIIIFVAVPVIIADQASINGHGFISSLFEIISIFNISLIISWAFSKTWLKVFTRAIKFTAFVILLFAINLLFEAIFGVDDRGQNITRFIFLFAFLVYLAPKIYKNAWLGENIVKCQQCNSQNTVYSYYIAKRKNYIPTCTKCSTVLNIKGLKASIAIGQNAWEEFKDKTKKIS